MVGFPVGHAGTPAPPPVATPQHDCCGPVRNRKEGRMSGSPALLVHGAWTGGWAWGFVRARLAERGVRSAVVDLPSAGPGPSALRDDVAAIRGALDALDGPVVVV